MVRRGVERYFDKLGYVSLAELTLASGRRCDLIALSPRGVFVIIEIKSSVEDFRADSKWPEYNEFCDQLYFATHAKVPPEIFPQQAGLIVADAYGAEVLRESETDKLAAATRKALMLRFARTASSRLAALGRFAEKSGLAVELPD